MQHPVVRAFLVSTALMGAIFLMMVLLMGWQGEAIGFMRLRVVNDTKQTWKIQPCWDINCDNTIGMTRVILRPGESKEVSGQWANDEPDRVVVGILKPHAEAFHYNGCVLRVFAPGKKVGLIRVSSEGPCFNVPEGGGGGG